MSFLTQRLANRFPLWTKIRKDTSSFGQRLLRTFAEGIEEQRITQQMMEYESYNRLARSFLWTILLDTEWPRESMTNNFSKFSTATVTGDSLPLTEVTSLVDLVNAPPQRLSLLQERDSGDPLIWTSTDPTTINLPLTYEHVYVVVEDSTYYSNKTIRTDRATSGLHTVHITGVDEDWNQISEVITITDDGTYCSRYPYLRITEISYEGFDGTISLFCGQPNLSPLKDKYRTLVFTDIEGSLEYTIESNKLVLQTSRLKQGAEYRNPDVNLIDNKEVLLKAQLLTDTDTVVAIQSIAISPQNLLLYVYSVTGWIYVYEPDLPEFLPLSIEDTLTTYIELHPLQPYVALNDTEYIWTRFVRPRYQISSVEIKRVAPDNTVSYLQADHTWTSSQTSIPGTGSLTIKDSWQDFKFSTEYDQRGQWNYICTVTTRHDTTIYTTAIYVPYLEPLAAINTGIIDAERIYFNHVGNLVIDDLATLYTYKENLDCFLADPQEQLIYLSDEYTSVEVTF